MVELAVVGLAAVAELALVELVLIGPVLVSRPCWPLAELVSLVLIGLGPP
jgi:hypothetical protein